MILPCSEAYLGNVVVIQTYLSRHFNLAAGFLSLRRNGFSSQIINQGQYFLEQTSWHGNLGQLERDAPPMVDDLGSDLDQLLP